MIVTVYSLHVTINLTAARVRNAGTWRATRPLVASRRG